MKGLPMFIACTCLLAMLGCQGGLVKYKVTGAVEYDGRPVTEGQITFLPDDKNLPAEGALIREGTYTAHLAAGTYKVKVEAMKKVPLGPGEKGAYPEEKDKLVPYIPAEYNEKTTLTAEVKGAGPVDFKLPRKN